MPWKESHVVDERLRFVGRLLDGEPTAAGASARPAIYWRLAGSRSNALRALSDPSTARGDC